MKSLRSYSFAVTTSFIALVICGSSFAVNGKPMHSAVIPMPRNDAEVEWLKKYKARNKPRDVDMVFIGDSITAGWGDPGRPAWKKYYESRTVMNLGVAGDRTQHLLWRLDNGNVDDINPKLVVLMIGTNNCRDNSPEETADGIKAVVGRLCKKLPHSKLLLLGIFPRDRKPDSPLRQANAKASELASKLADNKSVFFLDIGSKFLQRDGTLSKDVMPDLLHLSANGYEIWGEAIEPKVSELLGEKR